MKTDSSHRPSKPREARESAARQVRSLCPTVFTSHQRLLTASILTEDTPTKQTNTRSGGGLFFLASATELPLRVEVSP